MPPQFAHLSTAQLAEIHDATADLYELISMDPHFSEILKCQLVALLVAAEETLNVTDPLVDRQPVFVDHVMVQ